MVQTIAVMAAMKRIAVRQNYLPLRLYLLSIYTNFLLPIVSVSDCTSDNKKFLCSDNVTCIAIENVCNNRRDCKDGLDEGGICNKFQNNTACELNYCPSNAECFIWPSGPVCVCPKGFSYNSQKKTCEVCTRYGSGL